VAHVPHARRGSAWHTHIVTKDVDGRRGSRRWWMRATWLVWVDRGLVMVDLKSKPQTKKTIEAKSKIENGNQNEANKCLQGHRCFE
jgi:hypothetical protein